MKFSVGQRVFQKSPLKFEGRLVSGVVLQAETKATSVQGPAGPTSAFTLYKVTGDAWWSKDSWQERELLTEQEAYALARSFWQSVKDTAEKQLASIPD